MTRMNRMDLMNWMKSLRFPTIKKTNHLIERKRWIWIGIWVCFSLSASDIVRLMIICIKLMTLVNCMLCVDCIVIWQYSGDLM
jgi:hypothetical protein